MDTNTKKKLLRRLKIIEGQVRGIQRMVENDEYCIDVLRQSLAVKGAISTAEELLFKNHLQTHVVEQIKSGKEKKSTQEIIEIYKLSKRS